MSGDGGNMHAPTPSFAPITAAPQSRYRDEKEFAVASTHFEMSSLEAPDRVILLLNFGCWID